MSDLRSNFVFIAFAISLILGWSVIPHIVLISKRKRLFDKLDCRKEIAPPIPRLGGLAFFPITMFSFSFMLGIRYLIGYDIPVGMEAEFFQTYMFLMAGLVVIFFVGLADDLIGVSYKTKFMIQIVSATMLVFAGLYIRNLENIILINSLNPVVGVIVTILFIVFTINAYNLIDGVNGLCSGLSLTSLLSLGGWFIYVDYYAYAMLVFSLIGVVLAFFFFNVRGKRLQIFMGDTGSLTLGFMISAFSLIFIHLPDNMMGDFYVPINKLAIVCGLLFIPLFDTLRVFVSRIRRGFSPFHPDRTHIHHKLLDLGFTHIQSTMTLIAAQIFYIILNILLSQVAKLDNNITYAIDIILATVLLLIINTLIQRKQHVLLANEKKTLATKK